MMESMIETRNLTKKYGRTKVLTDCNLKLEKGKIYGLVGKNGAGKTTLMRMIAGLGIPTEGSIAYASDNIGALIEAPALNQGMTAKENLQFFRMLSKSEKNFFTNEELLDLVGLGQTGKKKAKDFSLGMRQRLGIATALIGKPDFLMLDEPVNGLDPIGVIEIRELVKRLQEEYGMTVLISSHNLVELHQTASDYIFIDRGVVKRMTTQEELDRENNGNLEEYFLRVIEEDN